MPVIQLPRWIKKLFGVKTAPARGGERRSGQPRRRRLFLEQLEPREMLSANPLVQSIDLTTPASPLTNASSVSYTVTFSEPVTGVDATDFQLAKSGTVTAATTQVSPVSASVYTVTVSGIAGNGTLGLNLVDDGSIHDLAGNSLERDVAFQDSVQYIVGAVPNSVAVADVNGDGKLDLVTANGDLSNTVSVDLGNGDGTFQNNDLTSFATSPYSVVVADVNSDGKPDIVTADGEATA